MSSPAEYRRLIDTYPALFENPPEAWIEVLLEEDDIRQVEAQMERRLAASGKPIEWARVGVAFQDDYLTVLRDAVRFTDGRLATYTRSVSLPPDFLGVVTLPIWRGQVLLISHFRHATRSWHLEIPRGFGLSSNAEADARQELREEIQATVSNLVDLGMMYPDTGATANRAALFLAEVEPYGTPERSEAISAIRPTSVAESERMIGTGELKDGFMLGAYARAKARSLLQAPTFSQSGG